MSTHTAPTATLVAGDEFRPASRAGGSFYRMVRVEGNHLVAIKNGSKSETYLPLEGDALIRS